MSEFDELTEKAVEAGLRAGHSQTQPTRRERSQNLHFILGEADVDLHRLARFMRWADVFAQEYAEAAVRGAVAAVADPLRAEGAAERTRLENAIAEQNTVIDALNNDLRRCTENNERLREELAEWTS